MKEEPDLETPCQEARLDNKARHAQENYWKEKQQIPSSITINAHTAVIALKSSYF